MEIQDLFYILGAIFIIAAITYFAWEYLFRLSKEVKTIILFCLVVIFFLAGKELEGRGI